MNDINHGTYSAYFRHKCRCDECRLAHNSKVAQNRRDRLARVGSLTHGIRSSYDAGCRCTKCQNVRSAKSRLEQELRRKRAADLSQQEGAS